MSRRKALINLHRIKDEDSDLPILEKSIGNFDRYSEIRSEKTDRVLRRRYVLITLNGMIGVVLMCTELQLAWNGQTLEINLQSKILRALIFFLTIILCIQLVDYYLLLLSEVTHDWLTKRARGFRVTRINVLKSTKLGPLFWCEIMICCLQPLPFVSGEMEWYKDSKWGLFMWLRLYMFGRILRDFTPVYRLRQHITKQLVRDIAPKFNWTLSLKYIISIAPILTYLTFTLIALSVTGQWMYVFEREHSKLFTFAVSYYISFLSMITGWPTDTYDEYNPQTFGGRFAAIVATIFGLMLLSFVIESFARLTQATSHQRPILNLVTLVESQKKERDSAAKLIQLVWRRYRWQNSTNMSQNRTIFNSKEALFCVKYIEYAKTLSRMRRERRAIQSQCLEQTTSSSSSTLTTDGNSLADNIKNELLFSDSISPHNNGANGTNSNSTTTTIVSDHNCHNSNNSNTSNTPIISSVRHQQNDEYRLMKESFESKIKALEDTQAIILNQLNSLIQMQQFSIQQQQQQNQQQNQQPVFNNDSQFN